MDNMRNKITDIPEPFDRNIDRGELPKPEEIEVQHRREIKKKQNNDMLFLLLIMLIFYDNRF